MKEAILIRVDPTLFEALKTYKCETGVPVSEFIRRAIRMALFADARNPLRPEVRFVHFDGINSSWTEVAPEQAASR